MLARFAEMCVLAVDALLELNFGTNPNARIYTSKYGKPSGFYAAASLQHVQSRSISELHDLSSSQLHEERRDF